jgi:DnaJ-domain-containing protein 1
MPTYEQEYIRCGKAKCHCRTGKGHGPYWYAYEKIKGKLHKKYIGKKLPKNDPPPPPPPSELSLSDAYLVLGVESDAPMSDVKKAYRRAIRAAHPDAGGTNERAVRVNAAWERIERARG